MKTILVLGHRGMLGNAMFAYLSKDTTYAVKTIASRWGEDNFEIEILAAHPDFIINCIGVIPQKKKDIELYESVNVELPRFLDGLGIPIIHPSTDCEFAGLDNSTEMYTKTSARDASDTYDASKAKSSKEIESSFKNTKIIRTSIIGHELSGSVSLLDWFLSQESEAFGYTDHYWNGITTLTWAKIAVQMIDNWVTFDTLNQYSTGDLKSKHELLCTMRDVYEKSITVTPKTIGQIVNKCLTSDSILPDIKIQLVELKSFYNK